MGTAVQPPWASASLVSETQEFQQRSKTSKDRAKSMDPWKQSIDILVEEK